MSMSADIDFLLYISCCTCTGCSAQSTSRGKSECVGVAGCESDKCTWDIHTAGPTQPVWLWALSTVRVCFKNDRMSYLPWAGAVWESWTGSDRLSWGGLGLLFTIFICMRARANRVSIEIEKSSLEFHWRNKWTIWTILRNIVLVFSLRFVKFDSFHV